MMPRHTAVKKHKEQMLEQKTGNGYLETHFTHALQKYSTPEDVKKVLWVFEQLDMPPPQDTEEFMNGRVASYIFSNAHGLALRIDWASVVADRVNHSPFVIKPFAIIPAGKYVVEICAGVAQESEVKKQKWLVKKLREQDLNFWDPKLSNIGRVPVRTPEFPDGMPIVIDRDGVSVLHNGVSLGELLLRKLNARKIKRIFNAASGALDQHYGPLKKALAEAWPDFSQPADRAKMRIFKEMCKTFTAEGKLVAGWDMEQPTAAKSQDCKFGDNDKTAEARDIALAYAQKLKDYETPGREDKISPVQSRGLRNVLRMTKKSALNASRGAA